MDVQDNEMQLSSGGQWLPVPEAIEGLQCDLSFEFQVLKIALKVVCTYLDYSVVDLERDAYPVLDELVRNVSTKNLEHVRSLKRNLTSLLAQVQKVHISDFFFLLVTTDYFMVLVHLLVIYLFLFFQL
ncbi:Magnesium transporter MRS2-4 [Camellia lanceoleosa]|nr:Magnesium transporter MRS2-4 [Camellia lanceoleosa]